MNKPTRTKWSEFNKEIADDHYYYLRSCIRQNFFPGSENAFLRIVRDILSKRIFDDSHQTTCTGIGYHSDIVPFETLQTVAARHFALMSEQNISSAVVSCITSFGIYTEILETWREFPSELDKIREYLRKATGREFVVPANVVHASDIIYKFRDVITAKAKYSLVNMQTGSPLRIADHIGCHYAKMFPNKGVGGAEFPKVLTGMITAWGGQTIDYPERRHCCGFGFRQYLVKKNRNYSLANSRKKFESMLPYKPEAILTNCPGCAMFLDRWQYTIAQMDGTVYSDDNHGVPVLTYEELAGIVLGFDPWQLGLQMHQVNVEPFLKKIGFQYDENKKYNGVFGKNIGKPAFSGLK